MFFCNLRMVLLLATWALLGVSSLDQLKHETDMISLSKSSGVAEREGRGLLHKHFPALLQTSGTLATSNRVNLFGKYLSSAFALTYGSQGSKGKVGSAVHDEDSAHLTFVKAVAQSKHPVEVLIISNQVSLPVGEEELTDVDNSLSSFLEDKVEEDKTKKKRRVTTTEAPVKTEEMKEESISPKNIITLKEKNTNLIKLVTTLARNYSLQVKDIIPFDDVPTAQKTNVIKDLIKINRMKQDPCYIIVVNGDEAIISEVLAIRGLSVTRVGKESKALNIYETQQIEALRKKLNKTEPEPSTHRDEMFEKHESCASFTLYVF